MEQYFKQQRGPNLDRLYQNPIQMEPKLCFLYVQEMIGCGGVSAADVAFPTPPESTGALHLDVFKQERHDVKNCDCVA